MSKDLLSSLIAKPQREIAGSSTAARFDFQKSWALCELIDRHCAGTSYMVAFEFHDDVLFLDSETNPNEVEFFQVKTSNSPAPRKLSSLTARPKQKSSIIGKMIANASQLEDYPAIKLILVSNSVYEFAEEKICAEDLIEKFKSKLIEKIGEELPDQSQDIISKIYFHVIAVPIDGIETYLRGKAVDLFEYRFGADFTQSVISWLRLLQGEIARRNNFPSDSITDVSTLLQKKCIGRSVVESTLEAVAERHRPAPTLTSFTAKLGSEGWSLLKITKIEKSISTAAADFKDIENAECIKLCGAIRAELAIKGDPESGLGKMLSDIHHSLLAAEAIPPPYADEGYILALILLVFHDAI